MPVFNYISVEDRWYPNRFGQSKLPVWVFIQTIGDRLWLIMNGSVKRPNRLRPRNKAAHTYSIRDITDTWISIPSRTARKC